MSQYLGRFLLAGCSSIALYCSAVTLPARAQSVDTPPAGPSQSSSYIGIGGALGLQGNTTSLGTGGVAVLSKVRFTENLSLHDATVLFGNGAATSMIILTADFPIRNGSGQTVVSPFLGGGMSVRYQEGLHISPAISGGIDIPLSRDFTGTVRVNAGFPNNQNADVGILVGAGYNLGR